jgi:hypothetical protein
MPTLLRIGGYRFFSCNEGELPHVHVERAGAAAKFWLHPDVSPAWWIHFGRRARARLQVLIEEYQDWFLKKWGESFENKIKPLTTDVRVTPTALRVRLADGREISAPLAWFPRLRKATRTQRSKWRLIGGGLGIHWEELDEDVSVQALLMK